MKAFRSSAVGINVLNRLISLVGGLGLLLAVAFKLSLEMQGFYYTFYSLAFLRFFAELGLTTAVVQFISHLSANEDEPMKLIAYKRLFFIWFAVSGVLLALALLPAIFLYRPQIEAVENGYHDVILPWVFFCFATGLSVFVVGLTSIVEGHRRILAVSHLRLWLSLTNFGLAALLIMLGFQLWGLPIAAGVSAAIGLGLLKQHSDILLWHKTASRLPRVKWRTEIWPFQWRLAVSWLTGFFIFYFLTPYVMLSHGPEDAGRLGLSLQIIQIINGVAILAVSTLSPVFGQFVAKGSFQELGHRFRQSTILSFVFLAILVSGFWAIYWLLPVVGLDQLQGRLISAPLLGLLTLAAIGTHFFFLLNYFLRAFKDEALWWVSAANAATTLLASWLFITEGGLAAAVAIFTFNSIFFWVFIGSAVVMPRIRTLKFEKGL
ncbi:hypothetical protein ACJ5NV_19145 [Loktanella agnita]|uniref:hypothetical protein n=1 Tax=Loktanella agnita TaxID=287097 RepID=UPI003988EB65